MSNTKILFREEWRLLPKYYQHIISHDLLLKQNYSTLMEIPFLEKIVCSTTSKMYSADKKHVLPAASALELLSGQKATWTYAKKSIATFQIRQDQILGCKVDLRKRHMYNFLNKWCRLISPRLRDGVFLQKNSHDTLSLGINTVMIFPELETHFELMENFRGLSLNFRVLESKKQDTFLLLSAFQFPSS
jgi:large subunit ribosomal protein L5